MLWYLLDFLYFVSTLTTQQKIYVMANTNPETVKSLLEAPIEKPVLLSDAASENLYNISHNIQEFLKFYFL